MNICAKCRKPQAQCTCTPEEKACWARAMEDKYAFQQKKIRSVFRHQLERMAAELERLGDCPTYEQVHCIEIDDAIWPMIELLWQKGYGTRYCCAGHPEQGSYSMYISFDQPYFFDFTTEDFGEGWSYTRTGFQGLYFSVTARLLRQLKKTGEDPGAYLEKQRAKLLHFVQNLPPARTVPTSLHLPGTSKGGKIIPVPKEEDCHD